MRIGVPKEIKSHEYRAGLTPASVRELVNHGHQVLVQTGTGLGIGFDDAQYVAVYAGGNVSRGMPAVKGDDIYAFALPK